MSLDFTKGNVEIAQVLLKILISVICVYCNSCGQAAAFSMLRVWGYAFSPRTLGHVARNWETGVEPPVLEFMGFTNNCLIN